MGKYDEFKRINDNAQELRMLYSKRDQSLDEMQNMLLLKWSQQATLQERYPHMQVTLSPEPRNAIKTAVRLMTANEPQVNVPAELAQNIDPMVSDQIERMAATMLRASDRVRGTPLHQDLALSGLTFDEVIISINRTADLVRYAKGGSRAAVARAERVAKLTPFLFVAHDPHGCYYDHDELGLRAFARRSLMKQAHILEKYGADGERALGSLADRQQKLDEYTVWSWWDLEYYACWVEGGAEPIHCEPHGLPFIPVVCHTVEGTRLFGQVEDQREPLLLTMQRSGLWQRQNLALSAMFTSVAAAGLWPQLVFNAPDGIDDPEVDTTSPLGFIRVNGGDLRPFDKHLIDPALTASWQLAQQLGVESTIYKQVGGQPIGNGATFSETSLLNAAGRQPLIPTQRKVGWAMGDALRLAFLWMAEEGGMYSARDRGGLAELQAGAIPDGLEIEVRIDVALPQDRLQMANVFNILKGAVSQEWLLENILNIKQPQDMMAKTLREQAFQLQAQAYFQQKLQEAAMRQQMAQRAAAMQQSGPSMGGPSMGGPGMGGPGVGGPGPGGMPPGPIAGGPGMGGLPPEMLMGGMQGPRPPIGEGGPEGGGYAAQ